MEHRKAGKSIFLFATLDGTISGWNPMVDGISAAGASHGTIAVERSEVGAVYSGLAIEDKPVRPQLYFNRFISGDRTQRPTHAENVRRLCRGCSVACRRWSGLQRKSDALIAPAMLRVPHCNPPTGSCREC
jgi:hypothetical protein